MILRRMGILLKKRKKRKATPATIIIQPKLLLCMLVTVVDTYEIYNQLV